MVTEPTVPVALSELLYVTTSVVVSEIERQTEYDTTNLHLILHKYCAERDRHLKQKGMTDTEIGAITAGVVDGLNAWLDEKAEEKSTDLDHLSQWEEELRDNT